MTLCVMSPFRLHPVAFALPYRVALVGPEGASLTYDGLERAIGACAAELAAASITRGSRVALLSESRPEAVVALLGSFAAGATLVPLDPKLTVEELAVLLEHARPALLVVSPALEPLGDALTRRTRVVTRLLPRGDARPGRFLALDRDPDEIALIAYTSGTTGNPKGVEVTFANLQFQTDAVDRAIGCEPREVF